MTRRAGQSRQRTARVNNPEAGERWAGQRKRKEPGKVREGVRVQTVVGR